MKGRQVFDQQEYDRRTPLNIVMRKPAPQTLYCVKCRRKVFTRALSYKKLRNGTYAVVSVHHECGTLMHKFTNIKITDSEDLK